MDVPRRIGVVGFVLALTFLLVLWTFRSVVIARDRARAQPALGRRRVRPRWCWSSSTPGRRDCSASGPPATIIAWLPMFLFVVLFGLSMDYHVFVVSRIRELAMRGMPTRDAVRHGSSARPAR